MSHPSRTRQHGLTLVEMMVVLLIAGLALSLGYQSLQQWRRAQFTVAAVDAATASVRLTEAWWRQAISGISARYDTPLDGDSRGFRASSGTPLLASGGIDVSQAWQLTPGGGGWRLSLDEGGTPVELALPDARDARFEYLDASGDWHERWPPGLGVQAARPSAVALAWRDRDGRERLWVATLSADPLPHFPAFELEEY